MSDVLLLVGLTLVVQGLLFVAWLGVKYLVDLFRYRVTGCRR